MYHPSKKLSLSCLFLLSVSSHWAKTDALIPPASLLSARRLTSFTLNSQVVSASVMASINNDDKNGYEDNNGKSTTTSTKKPKLSRPERKALERQQKQGAVGGPRNGRSRNNNNNRKNNRNNKRSNNNNNKAKKTYDKHRYDLHSRAVSTLNGDSTADDVLRAIKRAQNMHDVHDIRAIENFLLEQTDASFAYGYRGALLSRLAVAALHMDNHDLARKAIDVRRAEHYGTIRPMESAAIVRGLLRVHNVTDALEILEDELSIPDDFDASASSSETNAYKDRIKHRALSLASVASRHFFEGEPSRAVLACEQLAELGPIVRKANIAADEINMPWSRLIRGATQCESGRRDGSVPSECDGIQYSTNVNVKFPCNIVYSVLGAMTTFPSDNSDRIYEGLSNALVRRILFVTGAVDMSGCPPPDRGEAAFIGRSNVGKSSLVNMVTNRKSLAYTSKTPGKTQQFNFFTVNDKVGRDKEIKYGDVVDGEADNDSFYIVDLPGFGFAKVPQKQRDLWSDFMNEYISKRKNLRVIFHLIDSRHGPLKEDKEIMGQVGRNLRKDVKYVIILTKADKNVKGAAKHNNRQGGGKVSRDVMDSLRQAMQENKVTKTPVILTSSETKLGRDDIWRYLRLAAEG